MVVEYRRSTKVDKVIISLFGGNVYPVPQCVFEFVGKRCAVPNSGSSFFGRGHPAQAAFNGDGSRRWHGRGNELAWLSPSGGSSLCRLWVSFIKTRSMIIGGFAPRQTRRRRWTRLSGGAFTSFVLRRGPEKALPGVLLPCERQLRGPSALFW